MIGLYHKQHYYWTASFLYRDPTFPVSYDYEGAVIYDTRTCFTVQLYR